MSISAMANAAIGRRLDFEPMGEAPRGIDGVSKAAGGSSAPDNQMTSAVKVIVTYIPTEILTLYVAVVAALNSSPNDAVAGSSTNPVPWLRVTFWAFLAVTPLAVWVLYAVKVTAARKPIPGFSQLPVWEMVAGTIAYAAWAFALPNFPYDRSSPIAGIGVLVTSTVLGMVAPLFQRPLKATS
jgi:hypothetical protein